LNCTVVEYNPVAYLILKATLEYPAKYGQKLAEDVERYGNEVIKRVEKELGGFYRRDGRKALHYLWCWCIRCPYCGQRIPLTNNMWLDQRRKIGYRVIPTDNGNFRIEIGTLTTKEGSSYTQKGGKAVCIRCRNAISYEQMVKDIAERKDKEMIAVVVKDVKGKNYELPTDQDRKGLMRRAGG
jgi:putative DNA methylase